MAAAIIGKIRHDLGRGSRCKSKPIEIELMDFVKFNQLFGLNLVKLVRVGESKILLHDPPDQKFQFSIIEFLTLLCDSHGPLGLPSLS
jgi:hypothetical protein